MELILTTKIYKMYFKKENILLSALYMKNIEVSKILIENNINLLNKDKKGISPLENIIENKLCDLIDLIKFKFENNIHDLEKIYTKKEIRDIKEKIGLRTRKKKLSLKISKPFIPKNIPQKIKKIKLKKIDQKILKEDINFFQKKILEIQQQNEQIMKKIEKKKEIRKSSLFSSSSLRCIFGKAEYKSSKFNLKDLYYNLGKEIKFFSQKIKDYQIKSEKSYEIIYKIIQKDLKIVFPNNVIIDKGGSYKTGQRMPWSNLNITVSLRNIKNNDKKLFDFKKKIKDFYKNIKQSNKYSNVYLKQSQSLMILSFEYKNSIKNIEVEILFKYYINTYFPSNEKIILNYLKEYSELKIIYQIFRCILKNYKLDSPVYSGLNNICMVLILVYFFQNREINNKICKEIVNDNNTRSSLTKEIQENINNCYYQKIGKLLIDFFAFYNNFDYNKNVILTKINKPTKDNLSFNQFENSESEKKHKKDFLVIYHPYKNNIILSKSFKFTLLLKECIKLTYVSFFSNCSCPRNKKYILIKKKRRLSSKKINFKNIIHIKYKNRNSKIIRSYCNLDNFRLDSFRKCSLNINTFIKKYEKNNNNILSCVSNKEKEMVKTNYLFNLFYYNQEKPL